MAKWNYIPEQYSPANDTTLQNVKRTMTSTCSHSRTVIVWKCVDWPAQHHLACQLLCSPGLNHWKPILWDNRWREKSGRAASFSSSIMFSLVSYASKWTEKLGNFMPATSIASTKLIYTRRNSTLHSPPWLTDQWCIWLHKHAGRKRRWRDYCWRIWLRIK